jgi:hypothetical protein
MKKKPVKKIVLSKETLRRLEDGRAVEVKGGVTALCSGSCFNSCPKTCDC